MIASGAIYLGMRIPVFGEKIDDLLSHFSLDIGVDLGTSMTSVYVKDRGVVIEEPTMLVRQKKKRWTGLAAPRVKNRLPIAYGFRAKEMLSREPQHLEVISPLRFGIVSDVEAIEQLLAYYLKLVFEVPQTGIKLFKPRVVVGVPSSITDVEKRAVRSIFLAAGAREVNLVEESILAALGAGMSITGSAGAVVVDVGGGKTEVTMLSMGGAVLGKGIRVAGNDFDQAIVTYIRMKYGLLIGINTAERIKIEIGGVGQKGSGKTMIVRGRDLETGLPRSVKVEEGEIMEAMMMKAQMIAKVVSEVLDQSPPELLNDVVAKGILLVGRGALLKGLAPLLEHETRIPVQVIDDPGMAVIRGCGILVEDRDKLRLVKKVAGEN